MELLDSAELTVILRPKKNIKDTRYSRHDPYSQIVN